MSFCKEVLSTITKLSAAENKHAADLLTVYRENQRVIEGMDDRD